MVLVTFFFLEYHEAMLYIPNKKTKRKKRKKEIKRQVFCGALHLFVYIEWLLFWCVGCTPKHWHVDLISLAISLDIGSRQTHTNTDTHINAQNNENVFVCCLYSLRLNNPGISVPEDIFVFSIPPSHMLRKRNGLCNLYMLHLFVGLTFKLVDNNSIHTTFKTS